MYPPIKILTGIVRGKPVDQESIDNACRYFEGVAVDITIEKHKTKRSNLQNKFLWGVMWTKIQKFIFDTTGKLFSAQDIHDHYKHRGYFGFKESIDGDTTPKGSSESTTIEFMESIERLQKEWAVKGLIIEDPNQTDFLEEQ